MLPQINGKSILECTEDDLSVLIENEDYRENREESLMKKFLEVQGIGDNSD